MYLFTAVVITGHRTPYHPQAVGALRGSEVLLSGEGAVTGWRGGGDDNEQAAGTPGVSR